MKVINQGTPFTPVTVVLESTNELQVLKSLVGLSMDTERGHVDGISSKECESIKGDFYKLLDNQAIKQRQAGVKDI